MALASFSINPGQTQQFAIAQRVADLHVWNGSAYVAYSQAAAIAGALVPSTIDGNLGIATIPAGVVGGGDYLLPTYLYAGGSPATSDLDAGSIGYAGQPDSGEGGTPVNVINNQINVTG